MIPRVGVYLVNFWIGRKCIASCKVLAPTKFLANLNARQMIFARSDLLVAFCKAERLTISRMKGVRQCRGENTDRGHGGENSPTTSRGGE